MQSIRLPNAPAKIAPTVNTNDLRKPLFIRVYK